MPFPQYGAVTENTNVVHARYDSLVVKAQKRLSQGLTFLWTLTWARNEDNAWGSAGSNYFNTFAGSTPVAAVQNVYDTAAEWGLASSNVPVRVTAGWTYQLPFGKGRQMLNRSTLLDALVRGWAINGLAIIQNGFPLFVYQTNQNSVIGTGEQRPNATGVTPVLPGSPQERLNSYINSDAFTLAPAFTFGNVSRNIGYRGPGMSNFDLSLFKTVRIAERFRVELRGEALNGFNTPLFANPNTLFGSSNFGRLVYQTNTPREMQLGLRLKF